MPEIARDRERNLALGRNRIQCARKSSGRFRSRRAHARAARAAFAVELDSITQGPLAGGAARITKLQMMGAASAGGLFFGVAGATVPNTFSESHSLSLPRKCPRRCRGEGAS